MISRALNARKRKIFALFFALAAVVTGAMAQTETLLTTLTFGGSSTYGETTSGVVSATATNVGSYNGTFGWLLDEGGSLSVTAKEGYTITKCVFRQNAKTPITDTEAPFEIHANDWGGIIEDPYEEMNGVTSIEVYGYANAGGGSATTVVTITQNDFPGMDVSFTKDGVTVSADWIDNMQSGNLVAPGSFSTTLGNFTKIEVNAGEIGSLGEGWSGNSERQTWTGNASSVSFSGDISGLGHGITIMFTIEAATPAPDPTEGIEVPEGGEIFVLTDSIMKREEGEFMFAYDGEGWVTECQYMIWHTQTMNAESRWNRTTMNMVGTDGPEFGSNKANVVRLEINFASTTGGGALAEGWSLSGNKYIWTGSSKSARFYHTGATISGITSVVYVFDGKCNTPEPDVPSIAENGVLPGVFSISATTQAKFSQGNLQYQASTQTWQFGAHQYDVIGAANSNISSTYDGWIDVFGWGTGNNPTKTSINDNDYITFVDWGINAISNGGNIANQWRSLSKDEWSYLLMGRTNAASLLGTGSVGGMNGFIILPDDWTAPDGITFNAGPSMGMSVVNIEGTNIYNNANEDNFTHNTYTKAQWAAMEAAGAVFFPAAGDRYGNEPSGLGFKGGVYTSTNNPNDKRAYSMYFNSWDCGPLLASACTGLSVRLVGEVVLPKTLTLPESVSIVAPVPAGITDKGNGVYEVEVGTEFQIQATVPEHYSFVGWSDLASTDPNYTANPRTIVADKNLTIEPIFAIDTYIVTLASNDTTMGTLRVEGAGGSNISPREELNLGTDYPAGEHYQVLGEFSGPSWIGVGDINNETITVESLNGEIIDNITLEVYMPLHWTGYSIAATSGEVSGDVASYQDLVITNINATSVTLSRVGEGENGGSVLFSKIIVNGRDAQQGGQAEPITVTITNQDFPSEGNSFTKDGVTVSAETMSANYIADGTFSTTLGNITRIQVTSDARDASGDGWVGSGKTWVGNASSVPFSGYFSDMYGVVGIKFVITIEPTAAPAAATGIVDNGDGTYTVDWGTEMSIIAEPKEGYMLASWNGEPALSDTLKQTVEGALSVNATFKHIPAVITLPEGVSIVGMPIEGITDKGEGVYEVEYGTEFQISADIIPEHYHFGHWADLNSEDEQYAANPRTIVAGENLTIEPIFAIDTYTLTLATNDSTKGVVSLEGAGAGQDEGEGVDIVWDADFWNGIQAYMNGEDYVHANNSKDGITITFDGGDFENGLKDGKIKLDNSDNKLIFTSTVGKIKKIEIRGYASYKPEGWSRDGGLMWEGTPSDVVELFGQATFVHFVSATFTIEPDATTGKIVDNGDGTYTVDYGTELTFVAKPAEGFMLESWSNGAEVTGDTLKLTMTDELSLTANFKHIPATITLPEGVSIVGMPIEGITSKGEGVYEVEYGTEFQISADSIPAHYHFDHWADLADSAAMYAANPRTIVAGENLTVEPIFAIDTYKLTLATNDSTKGVVSLEGAGQGGEPEPSAQLIVPESWSSEVGVTITAADLPGFVASTEEAVKALPVPTEGSVFVIYNFKDDGGVEAVTFENGEYVRTTSTPVDHANASYYSNQGMIFLYTTAAGQAGQGGEGEEPEGEPVSVTIGDLTTAQVSDYLPACTMTNYAYSQQIYMANEIGGAGKITAITYWLMNNSNYTRNYEIYMKEVSESAFASNDAWVLLSESDKVASYALANDTDEPVAKTITLNAPFEYSGNGNLMIAIRDITGQWSDGAKGLVNDVNGNKTLYSFRDSKAYDVADPAGTGLLYAKRNVVKIDMIAAPSTLPEGIVDNGDGTYTVDWGTELTFVAQPAEGFMLESWSNGAAVTGDTLKLTMTEELSLTANFKHIPATITLPEGVSIVEPMPAGITSKGEGVYEVEYGTEFQISADGAPEHYHFDHWADLDSTNTEYYANPRTVVADTNFTADPFYTIDTYTLTLASNDTTMGKLTIEPAEGIVANGDGTYTVDWGTEVTFVAVPAEDYHLLSWSNGAAVTADNKQTLTITDQLSLSAFFKHDTYILTVEGAEVEVAKFYDGTNTAVVTYPGTLIGVQEGDSVKLTTTATFSSADIADNLDITLHYAIEVIDGGIYDNEYALAVTDTLFNKKGFIIESMIPDTTAAPEEEEAEVKEGIEVYGYGYCADGNMTGMRYHLKHGNPNQYKVEFEDARFDNVDWTDLDEKGPDGVIYVTVPVDVPTGDYKMTVTFRDHTEFYSLESAPITITFHVNLPETYVVALFDDVMAVVDTCECLTDIQWYWRANSTDQWTAIEGATGYYYKQAGGLSGEYFIKAKMNGIDTYTCPQDDMSLYGDNKQAKVRAYPNPVQSTTTVTIENSYRFEHDMRIVNLMGNEVLNTTFEGNTTTVEMDAFPHGSYIISVDGVVVNVMKQ